MDGALLIDKPSGMTSNDVLARIRRHYRGVRIGHAGTLDPAATGLLIALCGRATRLQDILLGATKEYEGEIALGIATDSDDLTGRVIAEDADLKFLLELTHEEVCARIREEFSGAQQQVPPQVSAVHIDGVRAYQLARKGVHTEIAARRVEIEFLALHFSAHNRLYYRIRCSKGTYVRSLARDIGAHFNSFASVASIRRLASGAFRVDEAQSLDEVVAGQGRVVPVAQLLEPFPKLFVTPEQARLLAQGRKEVLDSLPERSDNFEFAGLYRDDLCVALLQADESGRWKLRYVLERDG